MAVITSHTKRQKQVEGPPEIGLTRRHKPIDPDAKIFSFVNTQARMLTYKIVKYEDDDEEMQELVNQAVKDLHSRYIQFRDWGFEHTSPAVAKLLIRRQQEMDVKIYPNQERVSLRCQFCDQTFPNTTTGQTSLREHTMELHADVFLAETDRLLSQVNEQLSA